MKKVSNKFINALKEIKQIDAIISYADKENTNFIITQNSEFLLTEAEDYLVTQSADVQIENYGIQNIGIYWNTDILKSVCKMLDLEVKNKISKGTELNVKVGLLIDGEFEYVDYGKFYVIEDSKYNFDTGTYTLTAYDNMIKLNISAIDNPLTFEEERVYTLKQYLEMILNKCGIVYSIGNLTYNLNAVIPLISTDPYLNNKNVTYRDIIDDIAECLGTNFIIDDNNKFTNKDLGVNITQQDLDRIHNIIAETVEPTEEDLKKYDFNHDGLIDIVDLVVAEEIFNNQIPPFISQMIIDADILKDSNVYIGEKKEGIDGIQVYDGSAILNYTGNDNSVLKIKNNNIMNFASTQLLDYVLSKIEGFSYYTYNLDMFGVLALEPFDCFTTSYNNTNYLLCSLHNDINVTEGISEEISYEFSENDGINEYSVSSSEDKLNDASIELNKALGQVILKANSEGNLVQVELNADASEGSEFNVKADNINFEGKDFNITTENMKISLGTGANKVELINTSGLMTAIIIQGNVISSQFVGGTIMLPMGYSQSQTGYAKDRMEFEFTIPAGFVVDKAYVTLNHMPATISYDYGSTAYGWCRNMRLYKANSYNNGRLLIDLNSYAPLGESGVSYQSISHVFNENDFSGNNSGFSYATSSDIKSYISRSDNSDTFNKFKIETTDGSPSSYADMLTRNGCLQGTMTIIGHMKF